LGVLYTLIVAPMGVKFGTEEGTFALAFLLLYIVCYFFYLC